MNLIETEEPQSLTRLLVAFGPTIDQGFGIPVLLASKGFEDIG